MVLTRSKLIVHREGQINPGMATEKIYLPFDVYGLIELTQRPVGRLVMLTPQVKRLRLGEVKSLV